MRASRFNTIVDLENGNKLIFNAYTGAIAELPPDTYESIEKILSAPDSARTAEEKRHVDHLLYGGFLVDKQPDELTWLNIENDRHRFGNPVFSLAIAPTFECNLSCSYCSGRKNRGKMTGPVVKSLLNFARTYVKKCHEVQLAWFGGEPLLCVETIERVQQGMAELATKYDTGLLGSKVITNGYLLDGEMAGRLKAAGVSSAQVTLDGPQHIHDSTRVDADGKGTFETIVANISEAAETLDIVVRINTDIRNGGADAVRSLVELLDRKGILSRVGFYFGERGVDCQVCADVANRCKLTEEHAVAQLRLYRELADHVTSRIDFPYLVPRSRCDADSDTSFVVAPTGYLFKCWENVSPSVDQSVGSVFGTDRETFQRQNDFRFSSFDAFIQPDCTRCEVLPICMGGCPMAVKEENNQTTYQCSPFKDNLGELLVLRYLYEVREEVS